MRIPPRLDPLIELGVVDTVVRPLMSGKEADVYLVECRGDLRVAKVYKEATNRSFKHRADYTEGRRGKNTRTQRAIQKRSKFGREQLEASWRNAEVEAIHRLREAGVRVPEPYDYVDGVLVMELIRGEDGEPAPRLVDTEMTRDEAEAVFEALMRDTIRMLLAGVVHGDLSDFNVLMGVDGPVIIDLPQATDPAFNRNARKLYIRDVRNLAQFLGRYSRRLRKTRYGDEIWDLYERGELTVDSELTGRRPEPKGKADTSALLAEIEELERESRARREAAGIVQKEKFRPKPVPVPPPPPPDAGGGSKRKRKRKRKGRREGEASPASAATAPAAEAPPPLPLDDLDAFLEID